MLASKMFRLRAPLRAYMLTCNATPCCFPRPACRRVLQKWVSRFDLWPYLERFTIDATKEILAEMGGKPDFIIGNYRWAGGWAGGGRAGGWKAWSTVGSLVQQIWIRQADGQLRQADGQAVVVSGFAQARVRPGCC